MNFSELLANRGLVRGLAFGLPMAVIFWCPILALALWIAA